MVASKWHIYASKFPIISVTFASASAFWAAASSASLDRVAAAATNTSTSSNTTESGGQPKQRTLFYGYTGLYLCLCLRLLNGHCFRLPGSFCCRRSACASLFLNGAGGGGGGGGGGKLLSIKGVRLGLRVTLTSVARIMINPEFPKGQG